jgi:23S rRNA (cytosine1962-C5)-methyltransferase
MDISRAVILKPGKEKPIKQRHHWIFSGAVEKLPSFKNGDLLPILSSQGTFLGVGYFNRKSNIIGRILTFDETPVVEAIHQKLNQALAFRKNLFDFSKTNAFRLINGEGDGLPGLIIDIYDQVVVLQLSTLGMERLKDCITEWILRELRPTTIYEKSLLPSRREEGLEPFQGLLYGEKRENVPFKENGLLFTANIEKGQKTGFFLDHREMRQMIRGLSKGKRVLNAFSYTGGFSIYAMAGGAISVNSLDISSDAIALAKENFALNGFDESQQQFVCEDVFTFLRESSLPYDVVILDPPAFAKKQKDVIAACRGYKDINRLTMQKMPANSYLLTCSCSHHVNEELFQKVLFQAALEAGRNVRMIMKHQLAGDHPINLFHPESSYLKSFLLYIS